MVETRKHIPEEFRFEDQEQKEKDEEVEQLMNTIREIINDPERYIDKGGAGTVYQFSPGKCIKVLEDRENSPAAQYMHLGNPVQLECAIQERLSGIEVSGVRAPTVFGYFKDPDGHEKSFILMEELDAINLQHALNDESLFPNTFDADKFSDALYDYLSHLHDELEIVHDDLAPRNVMIDRNTGMPRLIDFGRSKQKNQAKSDEFDLMIDGDMTAFDDIADKLHALTNKE